MTSFRRSMQLLCIAVLAAVSTQAWASEPQRFTVHGVLVIPTDRTVPPEAEAHYATLINDIQDFYADELERHGHGRRTFTHELHQHTGTTRLHIVHSDLTAAELAAGTRLEHYNRLIAEAVAGGCSLDTPGQAWLVLSESWWQKPDGSLDGIVALGIRGRRDGNENNGIGVRSGPVLQAVGAGGMADDSVLAGTTWDVLGPHTLAIESVPFFQHGTRSGITSSIVGAVAHELGHSFGLLHVYENDGMWCGARQRDRSCVHYGVLMGNGFRAWRSRSIPGTFATEETPEFLHLASASADLLSMSPFFSGSTPASDPSPPTLDDDIEFSYDEQQRRVTLTVTARDKESGIALVQLYNGHETAWSQLYTDRPSEISIDISTDRLPKPTVERWRLRVFNGAFHERQRWLPSLPRPDDRVGPRVHIIPIGRIAPPGSESRLRARVVRLDAGDLATAFRWTVDGLDVGAGPELLYAFEHPGLYEVGVTIRTTTGATTASLSRVRVPASSEDD